MSYEGSSSNRLERYEGQRQPGSEQIGPEHHSQLFETVMGAVDADCPEKSETMKTMVVPGWPQVSTEQ